MGLEEKVEGVGWRGSLMGVGYDIKQEFNDLWYIWDIWPLLKSLRRKGRDEVEVRQNNFSNEETKKRPKLLSYQYPSTSYLASS